MTEPTAEARYFERLARAYEIPLESEGFERFLDAAHVFFALILAPDAVHEFVSDLRGARFETEPGAGAIMLYQKPLRVASFILDAIDDAAVVSGRAENP